jgi:hypothetical protein
MGALSASVKTASSYLASSVCKRAGQCDCDRAPNRRALTWRTSRRPKRWKGRQRLAFSEEGRVYMRLLALLAESRRSSTKKKSVAGPGPQKCALIFALARSLNSLGRCGVALALVAPHSCATSKVIGWERAQCTKVARKHVESCVSWPAVDVKCCHARVCFLGPHPWAEHNFRFCQAFGLVFLAPVSHSSV